MSEQLDEVKQKADEAFSNLEALMGEIKTEREGDNNADRIANLEQKAGELGDFVAEQKQKQADLEAKQAADQRFTDLETRFADLAKSTRLPSKASAILGERQPDASADNFFTLLATVNNPKTPTDVKQAAEKALTDMGSTYMGSDGQPMSGKAMLGSTDATGGYLAPRAVVAEMTQVQIAGNPFRRLLTVVTGIAGPTVEIPHLGLAPTRAVVIARGATKTNADFSLANYTATFYTLAVITDAATQWLRQTGGRGEQIIRQRGAAAVAAGEAYYVLQGSGSSEPKGLLTSIGTSGTFVTTHSSPSVSTIAGNFATSIANAAGAIAGRSQTATGVVMNSSDFWLSLASGADAAGFYLAPGGANTINATGAFDDGSAAMSIWGLPVVVSTWMPTDSLVVGNFKAAELYIGADLRIDTSTEAGDRWDKNLQGFRFEEDMAFNADPYVAAGLFQRIVNVMA